MEIDEFLTKIEIRDAGPTLFNASGQSDATTIIKTHTKTKDMTVTIDGILNYNHKFPAKIFSMDSGDLKNILSVSDTIDIIESKIYGHGIADFAFNLQLLSTGKRINVAYDTEPIILDERIIKTIQKVANTLDMKETDDNAFISIHSSGKDVVIKLENKTGNVGKIKIDQKFPEINSLFSCRFLECIKLAGNGTIELNLDGYNPNKQRPSRGFGMLKISGENYTIMYYISEIPQKERTNTGDDNTGIGREPGHEEENNNDEYGDHAPETDNAQEPETS